MGFTATATLAYGVDLGGPDRGWKITDDELTDHYDVEDYVARKLATGHGAGRLSHAERQTARETHGVEIVTHGHYDFPGYLLVVCDSVVTADWGDVTDVIAVTAVPAASREGGYPLTEWDRWIARALEVLGVTPENPEPRWLLVADYG